ncbi:MAG: hypothetical protein Q8903_11605 [Bacteroidota bacterium]|nr:hypothetical protein [Bacteroidota bacterium]
MFDKEIKFITDFNLNKIVSSGNGFTLKSLKEAGLHPAILQFISAELDYLIFLDRKKLLQNSSFDYSGKELAQYFNSMAGEIKKNKKLSYDAVKKLVLQAVSFNLNFLVRPKWSLNKLIFNEAANKSVDEIKYFLNYTFYYEFIKKIFTIFADKKKLQALTTDEFENVFNKIEKELVANQLSEMLDYFLFSTAEFINQGEQKKYKIPLYLLEKFLEEKKLDNLLGKITELDLEPKQKINVQEMKAFLLSDTNADLAGILDYKRKEAPAFEPRIENLPKPLEIPELDVKDEFEKIEIPENEEFPSVDIYEPPVEIADLTAKQNEAEEEIVEPVIPEIKAVEQEGEGFKKIFAEELSKEMEEPETEPENSLIDKMDEYIKAGDIGEDSGEDVIYENKFVEDDDEVQFEPVTEVELEPETEDIDISGFNKKNDEEFLEIEEPVKDSFKGQILLNKFTSVELNNITINVFNGDNDDCLNTLEHLSEAEDYDKATEILKEVFFTYRVNPYSKDAITLTNKVLNYFQLG